MSPNQDVSLALNRIRAAISRRRRVISKRKKYPAPPAPASLDSGGRRINLGLDRIRHVVPTSNSWLGVHVGGTNGKGSICAFLSGLFKLAGIRHGMFLSPAFPDKRHGVTIDDRVVNKRVYEIEANYVEERYKRIARGWRFRSEPGDESLTPFEHETATAFRVFEKMRVPYAIVEVGMGGKGDATDVMDRKACTVISKIGLDHREYLGNTVEEIAKVKAGIMRRGVPCIVDASNPPSVINVLRRYARAHGTQIFPSHKALPILEQLDEKWGLETYQMQNLLCAVLAFRHMFPHKDIDVNRLLETSPFLPGRLEEVHVSALTAGLRQEPILVDGAHNLLGAEALGAYVDSKMRKGNKPVTWLVAFSSSVSKPFGEMLQRFLRPQDNLAFVEYTQGENEPPSTPANFGRDFARTVLAEEDQVYAGAADIKSALQWACNKAGSGPVIVTGSLYLIRQLYELEGIQRKRVKGEMPPGRSQLWRYMNLQKERELTADEAKDFEAAVRGWESDPRRRPPYFRDANTYPVAKAQDRKDVLDAQRDAASHRLNAAKLRKDLGDHAQAIEDAEATAASLKALSSNPSEVQAAALYRETEEYIRETKRERDNIERLIQAAEDACEAATKRVGGRVVRWEADMSYEEIMGTHEPGKGGQRHEAGVGPGGVSSGRSTLAPQAVSQEVMDNLTKIHQQRIVEQAKFQSRSMPQNDVDPSDDLTAPSRTGEKTEDVATAAESAIAAGGEGRAPTSNGSDDSPR